MAELCSVCNKKIGGFSGVMPADEISLALCQKQGIRIPSPICRECINKSIAHASSDEGKEKIKNEQERLAKVELFTFNPYLPDTYKNLGLLTAYAAIGTGLFTEFLSSFTDLVGAESKTYNKKMNEATDICISRIRNSALEIEADAIIGDFLDKAPPEQKNSFHMLNIVYAHLNAYLARRSREKHMVNN